MSKPRCLLALVFLGSITLVPVGSWADAIHPDPPSICDAVAGNLVMNCGFETGDFTDWTVKLAASGSFLSVPPPMTFEHSGLFAAGFGATGTTDDSISQVLSTTAGRSFDLSFFLFNLNDTPPGGADFSASWDGTKVFSAPTTLFFPYTKFSVVVPGTGSDTLQFAGRHEIGAAFFLDDVVVTPIPEPSTLSLFGMGLLLGGRILWCKKRLVKERL